MTSTTRSLMIALACLASGSFAQAQTAAPTPGPAASAVAEACRADVQKLCAGIEPGEGRIGACMKEHKSELSRPCKKELMQARKAKQGSGM